MAIKALALLILVAITGEAIAMSASGWTFRYSPGMPAHPLQIGTALQFKFPIYNGALPCASDQACPGAHYLTRGTGKIAGKSILVTGRVDITGSPQFEYRTEPGNTCNTPASFHLMIQRAGDNLTQDYYRWWSNPSKVNLQPGAFSLTVPLTPDQWSSVFGHMANSSPAARAGFIAALADAANIGMTFGGGCFFGHGVNVRGGTATMTITAFAVQ